MKKTLFSLFTAVSLALLYCPAAFALTEDEAAAAVDAQGKDAVSGNLFLWMLCAIAFLKVSTKPLWGWALQKPPLQLLPQKPHPATPLQAGFPAW